MIPEAIQYSDNIPLSMILIAALMIVVLLLVFAGAYLTGDKTKPAQKYEHDDVTGDFNV
jgi:hypothetical protein